MNPDKMLPSREQAYRPLIESVRARGFEVLEIDEPQLYNVTGAGTRNDLARTLTKDGRKLFLKAALDSNPTARAEIRKNIDSYRFCEGTGFFPEVLEEGRIGDITYYIGEYAGVPLTSIPREELQRGPLEYIATSLERMYSSTIRPDIQGIAPLFFKRRVDDIRRYLEDFVIPSGYLSSKSAMKFQDVAKQFAFTAKNICVNTGGELTPEHVFLNPSRGIVIIDPRSKDNLLGNPCFDLSMLALLATDINKLTENRTFFDDVKSAYGRLSLKLEPDDDPEKLWGLGLLRQCLLSSRFRLSSDPETARDLCKKAATIIESLLEARP